MVANRDAKLVFQIQFILVPDLQEGLQGCIDIFEFCCLSLQGLFPIYERLLRLLKLGDILENDKNARLAAYFDEDGGQETVPDVALAVPEGSNLVGGWCGRWERDAEPMMAAGNPRCRVS